MSGRNKNDALIYKLLFPDSYNKNDKGKTKEENGESMNMRGEECKRERNENGINHNNSSSNNSNSKLSSMIKNNSNSNIVNSDSSSKNNNVKESVIRNNSSNSSNKKIVTSSSSSTNTNHIKNKPSSIPPDKRKDNTNINKSSTNIKPKPTVKSKEENIFHEKVLTSSVSELAKLYLTHKKDFQQLFNNPSSSYKSTTPSTHKQHQHKHQQQPLPHKPKPIPTPQTNHKQPPSLPSSDNNNNNKYLSKKRNPPPSSKPPSAIINTKQQQSKPLPQKQTQQPPKKPQHSPPPTKVGCNLCKCYHYPNQHVRPINNANNKQSVNAISSSKKQSQPPLSMNKTHKEYDPLNTFKYNNKNTLHSVFQKPKTTTNVQKKSKPKINGYFSREDFEKGNDYDDDFYDDDDNENFREEMESVLKQFRKGGNHDYKNGYYDNGDIEEATFEMLQDEESKSRKIGKIEDDEELRKIREAEEDEDEEEEDEY